MRPLHLTKACLLFFFCCALQSYGQNNFLWKAGGDVNDEALANAVDTSGNMYTTGYFSGTAHFGALQAMSHGLGDVFVVKQSPAGAIQWVSSAGGNGSDRATAIETDAAGNIYICGFLSGTASLGSTQLIAASNTQDNFVAKLDASGNFLWANQYGGNNIDLAFGLTVDRNSNVIVTGQFRESAVFGSTTLNSIVNPVDGLPSYDIFIL